MSGRAARTQRSVRAARSRARGGVRRAGRTHRVRAAHGMTLIELCIVIVILGVLMTMAAALLMRARTAGNEASARGTLRTIHAGQIGFAGGCGNGGFASSLLTLSAPALGGGPGYVPAELGGGAIVERSGYRFRIQMNAGGAMGVDDCAARPTQTGYYASGVPVTLGNTGERSFAVNHGGELWQVAGITPPAEPFGPPATQVR